MVKVGNYHGGYGKTLVQNEKEWQELRELLYVTEDYITVEPFIDYQRDLRYLAIGDEVWAMSRRGASWKANVDTQNYEVIEPTAKLTAHVRKLQAYIGADIVAIDVLEEADGALHILEYNDIPGLSGFSEGCRYALATALINKMEAKAS